MSRFEDEYALLSEAIDDAFGDCVTYTPYAQGPDRSAGPQPDISRPALEVVGVFVQKLASTTESNSYDPRQSHRPGVVSTHLWFEISSGAALAALAVVGAPGPFPAKADDHIRKRNGEAFTVAFVDEITVDGLLRLRLNKLKTPF